MSKVLAIDLDGTLFYPKKKIKMIPKKNLDFLHDFIDQGNKVIITSGRNLPYAKMVKERINRDIDIIGCNSAFVVSNNQLINECPIDNRTLYELVEDLDKKFMPRGWMVMSKDYNLVMVSRTNKFITFCYKMLFYLQGVYKEEFIISEETFQDQLKNGKVYKVMMVFGITKKRKQMACQANIYIRKHFNDKIESSWTDTSIELTAAGVSKSKGLEEYCLHNHIDKNDVYVIGDSGNDISMFNTYKENSFCMKHASPKVKKYAKHIVSRVCDVKNYIKEEI